MKSRDLKLTFESLRNMGSDTLVAMRGDIETILSEKRAEIERCLLQIEREIPRTAPVRGSTAGNGVTRH
jgi:hypothetical protein